MVDEGNISGWIALFMGIYAISAGIGEVRQLGFWAKMVRDFARNRALQFLTGFVCLAVGAAIYLVNPWNPDDWLSILITVLGGWIVIEGAIILAFGDKFLTFAAGLMQGGRLWAFFSILIGIGLTVVGLIRV